MRTLLKNQCMWFWLLSLRGLSHLEWHGARGFSPVLPLSLDVAFFTPPPLCPVMYMLPHIKNVVYAAQIGNTIRASPDVSISRSLGALNSYRSRQLVLGLVPYWERACVRLQWYFSPAHFSFCSSSNYCKPFNPTETSNARLLINWWVGWPFTCLSPLEKVLMDICR